MIDEVILLRTTAKKQKSKLDELMNNLESATSKLPDSELSLLHSRWVLRDFEIRMEQIWELT